LYKNNARTTLFMLESIARLVTKATADERAKKWRKVFKRLEDMLGQIDYYDAMVQEFSQNKNVSKTQMHYLRRKKGKALTRMNNTLKAKDFYRKFMINFSKTAIQDFNDAAFLKTLEQNMKKDLQECALFFGEFKNGFHDMEHQVHELRRRLRWLSIYAQSLHGVVVLKSDSARYKWEKEFITPEVKASSFNKLPVKSELNYHIKVNQKAFYALSFVIQELGYIKDKGLSLECLGKAIQKTSPHGLAVSHEMALAQINGAVPLSQLLDLAYDLLDRFFNKHAIHKLLLGAR
jgi:hypothetical protein